MHILYIDPTAGSIIVQSLIAGVLGIVFIVKNYWIKIKAFFHKILGKEKKTDD
jgi:hypothetical protein